MAILNAFLLLITCSLAGLALAYIDEFEFQASATNLHRRKAAKALILQRRQLAHELNQNSHHIRSLYPRALLKNWRSVTIPSPASSAKGSSKASSLVDTHSSLALSRSSTGSSGSRTSLGSSAPNSPKSSSGYSSSGGMPSSPGSVSSGYSSSSSAMRKPLLSKVTGIQEYSPPGSLIGAKHGPSRPGALNGIQEVPSGIAERTGIQEYKKPIQGLPPPHGPQGIQERPTGIQEYNPSGKNAKQALPVSTSASDQNGVGGAAANKAKSRSGFRSWFGGNKSPKQTNSSPMAGAGITPGDVSNNDAGGGNVPPPSKGGFLSRFRGKSAKTAPSKSPGGPNWKMNTSPDRDPESTRMEPVGGGEYVGYRR